jgi:hypothetical protein
VKRAIALALAVAPLAFAAPAAAAPARDTEPVVLTGADLPPGWAVPADTTARLPLMDLVAPADDPHNHYADPDASTAPLTPSGTATDRLLGFRWDAATSGFVQVPFQVDERFTRYLDNTASGFSPYSGEDQHTTYAYDREGFRFWNDGPADDPCRAQAASPPAKDPVAGLDTDDELAFMAADAGPRAPTVARPPAGIEAWTEVRLGEPSQANAPAGFLYIMRAAPGGPRPAFDASDGYVRYARDANADLYAFSQSTYSDYGNARTGVFCDDQGNVVRNADGTPRIERRRPRDTATVTTPRYRYRYDGRWLMTKIEISGDGGASYGPDLVDRWKARAFQQDPASQTPCCGYEEEDTNWGGSSTLLGERTGPVRAIRETWGADSGTNVIRRETFYRDEVRQRSWLRVHPIPPLDGIYAQWDFNAGRVDRYFNSRHPDGVAVDGRDDEVLGNLDDPCSPKARAPAAGPLCDLSPYHQSVDVFDPLFSDPNASLGWSMVTGDSGTIVDRITTDAKVLTPGGAAQSILAVPYYRDNSCFDDGTGSDPGPKLHLRSGDEPQTASDGTPRRCWTPADGVPDGSDRFFQGSIATHGVHLLTIVDSDNGRLTVPTDEIVSDWRMVMLPGRRGYADGERYGGGFESPLAVLVTPRR